MSKKRIGAQTGKKIRSQILFPCAGSGEVGQNSVQGQGSLKIMFAIFLKFIGDDEYVARCIV